MDSKESKARTRRFIGNGAWSNLKGEFKKISWTSAQELKAYSKVVIGTIFVVGLGVYFIDVVAEWALSILSTLVRMVIS